MAHHEEGSPQQPLEQPLPNPSPPKTNEFILANPPGPDLVSSHPPPSFDDVYLVNTLPDPVIPENGAQQPNSTTNATPSTPPDLGRSQVNTSGPTYNAQTTGNAMFAPNHGTTMTRSENIEFSTSSKLYMDR